MAHERVKYHAVGKTQYLNASSIERRVKNDKVRRAEHFTRKFLPMDFSSQSSARYIVFCADRLVAGAKPCTLLPLSVRAAEVVESF